MDNPYEFVSPLIDEDIKPEIDLEIKNKEIMAQNESELTRCHKCKKVFKNKSLHLIWLQIVIQLLQKMKKPPNFQNIRSMKSKIINVGFLVLKKK